MRARAFKEQPRRVASGTRRLVDGLTERMTKREVGGGEACESKGYTPKMRGGTNGWPGLSPSLRGCYADPIEVALEEHGDRMPPVIPNPGEFETRHQYSHDPSAWPRSVKVITVCRSRTLRTFVMQPGESLSVFGGAA